MVDMSDERFSLESEKHLLIESAEQEDNGRYTCHAENKAGVLDTDFALKVIGMYITECFFVSKLNSLTNKSS